MAAVASVIASASARKLRVGVFADSPRQPRWLLEALAQVAAADCAELRVVCTGEAKRDAPPALWRAFETLDTKLVARRDLSAAADIRMLAPASRCVTLDPRAAADHIAIRALDLDVAIVLGDRLEAA